MQKRAVRGKNALIASVEAETPASTADYRRRAGERPLKTPILQIKNTKKGQVIKMPYSKEKIIRRVAFTPDEWKEVCRKTEKAKMKVNDYIKRMALCGEVKIYTMSHLSTITRAFGRIGTNLNQIAKVANSTNSVTQKDIADMQEQFKDFERVMENYLFELRVEIV